MRTGILSDDNAKRYQPLPQTMHDQYFVRPHLHTHGLYVKPTKKGRARSTTRSLAPATTIHAYAQLLNPMNVVPFVESFGNRLDAAPTYEPPVQFHTTVAEYNRTFPKKYSTSAGMPTQTAFFIQEVHTQTGHRIDLDNYFSTRNGNPSPALMKTVPLTKVFQDEYNNTTTMSKSQKDSLKSAYDDALRMSQPFAATTPPVPANANIGASPSSTSAASSPSQTSSQGPSPQQQQQQRRSTRRTGPPKTPTPTPTPGP